MFYAANILNIKLIYKYLRLFFVKKKRMPFWTPSFVSFGMLAKNHVTSRINRFWNELPFN